MSDYHADRRRRRAEVKAALLPILQRADAAGEAVDFPALASRFRRGTSTLRAMRAELAEAGLISAPRNQPERIPADLAARVAAVRAAKLRKWERVQKKALTDAELDEVLPSETDGQRQAQKKPARNDLAGRQ